ncbi:helix-turn-helix transcriptional regulator [Corynebacterium ammoniagenes]|uniref:helix-turn-helix domain-containing protein n=1 Tax=Corynebacterium ammoniagenes TaxID=1697 RepID=UPI0014593187|nr:helix-turn-helix transcriptional regulator [Corynebacterium ammoniagenes]NMF32500.1 helix-turn-helix transcriptional regulator [Corynebacterium ammoniagenes]
MDTQLVASQIAYALVRANMSQRRLADETEISQSTLSRIISGERAVTMPELILIARATGTTVAQLAGTSSVSQRVQYAARSTNASSMESMRHKLLHFVELNDYLDDHGIPSVRQGRQFNP